MKNYETRICVWCGKDRDKHHGDFLHCDETTSFKFRDSGTDWLCSEPVASKLLEALEEIARESNCSWTRIAANKAINEALKRE